MILQDIVRNLDDVVISYRCNYPNSMQNDLTEKQRVDGIFAGVAQYKDGKLHSLDGDYYSLNDEVVRFEVEEDNSITIWQEVEWSCDFC